MGIADNDEDTASYNDSLILQPLTNGLVCERRETGIWTNVQHRVAHHSPTGFEWGYGGSGPADLALNACEELVRMLGYGNDEMVDCWRGQCSALAWQLHQDFKWQFIAPLPPEGGSVSYTDMKDWMEVLCNHCST